VRPTRWTLSILDPTSLLGREVTDGIARAFPDAHRRLFHTGADPEHLIAEVAGEAALVPPLLELEELDGSAAVILTATPAAEVAGRLLDWLRANPAVALLDCTQPGVTGAEASCVVDTLPPGSRELRWYHLVDPSLAAPTRWLKALLPLGPEAFHLTLLCPVSGFGAGAIDELASQGTARLSGRPTARPVHLPAVLAFDLAPAASERFAALEAQLGELFPDLDRGLHVIDTGIFHGNLATVLVRCAQTVAPERARALLRATPGFRLARRNETVTASAVVEREEVVCGELQVRGPWVTAWLVADGLRVGGTSAVVELLASLTAS
jgi:hypothetical protein